LTILTQTDVVIGVSRAADQATRTAATARLERLGETAVAGPRDWSAVTRPDAGRPRNSAIPAAASRTGPGRNFASRLRAGDARSTDPGQGHAGGPKTPDALRQFEAFVLQSFIQSMLPKDAEDVFGRGTAGSFWKSMMAEKLADQIARSGALGIADQIAKSVSHGLPDTANSPSIRS